LLGARNLTLDEAIGVGLRRIHLGVLARVLNTLVPGQVNLKVVLVGKRVAGGLDFGSRGQDLLAHFVHGVLHGSALVGRERAQGNRSGVFPGFVKPLDAFVDGRQGRETLPGPAAVDDGAQDAVPGLGKAGEVVADKSVKGRAGALEDSQAGDAALEVDAGIPADKSLDGPDVFAVAKEAVGVRGTVDGQAGPAVHHNVDVGDADVRVRVDEVGAQDTGKELGRVDGVLLCLDVDGVLDGVRGDDDAVVRLGVPSVAVSSRPSVVVVVAAYEDSISPWRTQQTVISVTH